jgi:glycosyltransferase involved in cell wall biosynthesis
MKDSASPTPVSSSPNRDISIVIPARNEELNIGSCLSSLVNQRGPSFEIIVVDDHSQDRTREIAASFGNVRLMSARPLENGWTGKANAIRTAIPFTNGEWFLFTDADTTHMPDSLGQSLCEAKQYGVSLLSFSPKQNVGTFWEHAVQPIIFSELARTFSYEQINDPKSSAAAANGQYILVHRREYEQIGGHSSVRGSLLEDVELAKHIKRLGPIRFRYGPDIVSARMYRNWHELVEGWTKNLAGLFEHPLSLAVRRSSESVIILGCPWAIALTIWTKHLLAASILGIIGVLFYLVLARRLRRGGWPFLRALPSIIGLPLFCFLLFRSFREYSLKKSVVWKGRTYRPE